MPGVGASNLRAALVGLVVVTLFLPEFALYAGQEVPGGALPTSRVANGVYDVYATRVGLVGHRTSSRHLIVESDFFVALPACTPTNCPNGATRGNMTLCGSLCYVKVVNPLTRQCRVEPIKDLGPWFTVDDWWSPTRLRHLNALSTNPQILPQGYTAADAARDGLDVGFGLDSDGVGYDNTGQIPGRSIRAVGNRAAIDLADGTWRNLELDALDSIGTNVLVHLLWQTGENPGMAAERCGHPLDQKGGTMTPLPAPGATPGSSRPIANGSTPESSAASDAMALHLGRRWNNGMHA